MFALINPFYGRISRSEWWLSQFAIFALAFFAMFMTIMFASDPNLPTSERTGTESSMLIMIILGGLYMNFATCLNRLRDASYSRFLYLSFLLPTVGTGLMIYFCGIAHSSDA
jgi:uncharacterized membrane protein YhaH (DUF805 family)